MDRDHQTATCLISNRQPTLTSLSTRLCQNGRQRRHAIARAQLALARAEGFLLVAILFVVFLYPLLLDPTLLFNLSGWMWWVKGFAWIGPLAWAVIRLFLWLPLAPAQITGATVEAMAQAAPVVELVSFPTAPVETECALFPWRLTPALTEQGTKTQAQWHERQLCRRRRQSPRSDSAFRRLVPPPSRSPKPSI